MEQLYVLLISVFLGFSIIYIKHKIQEYIENRRFNKMLDDMIKREKNKYDNLFMKALEQATPQIINYIKNKRNESKM